MKNLSNLIKKKQISSLNSTLLILLFKCIVKGVFIFFVFFNKADAVVTDTEGLENLGKRLHLYPHSQDDYEPIIQIVESQLSVLRQKDLDRAYFYYTSKDFQKQTSLDEFKRFIQANPVLSDNKSITMTNVRIDDEISYYQGNITSTKGGSRIIDYNLIPENGSWKIQSMLLSP